MQVRGLFAQPCTTCLSPKTSWNRYSSFFDLMLPVKFWKVNFMWRVDSIFFLDISLSEFLRVITSRNFMRITFEHSIFCQAALSHVKKATLKNKSEGLHKLTLLIGNCPGCVHNWPSQSFDSICKIWSCCLRNFLRVVTVSFSGICAIWHRVEPSCSNQTRGKRSSNCGHGRTRSCALQPVQSIHVPIYAVYRWRTKIPLHALQSHYWRYAPVSLLFFKGTRSFYF